MRSHEKDGFYRHDLTLEGRDRVYLRRFLRPLAKLGFLVIRMALFLDKIDVDRTIRGSAPLMIIFVSIRLPPLLSLFLLLYRRLSHSLSRARAPHTMGLLLSFSFFSDLPVFFGT